jgi:multiple sugar transport system ATP-binding protein
MARIKFERVSKRYPNGFTALENLDLDIQDKEFLVLLGPSGCGKSTTLNMIAGLEDVSEGNLFFDSTVMNTVPPHRRDVAMVFQSYALYPHKSVYENIAFGLRMRKHPKDEIDQRVRDAARRLEIESLLERRPNQLSGGQRQRVALGRAMVRQPSVFLMDEPLSNLDATLRISMRAELKQLHQAMQTTFVYVTHDQAEALTLADRIVVMKEGVVQQIGSPDQIYEQPRNMFVASFLGNPPINYLDGQLEVDNGAVTFKRGGLSLLIPLQLAQKLTAFAGREVTIGIRAEDVSEHSAPPAGQALSGRITSVLPVGSDNFLEIEIEGKQLFFRVGKEVHHKDGDNAVLAVNVNRLHVFDKQGGQSLLWPKVPE